MLRELEKIYKSQRDMEGSIGRQSANASFIKMPQLAASASGKMIIRQRTSPEQRVGTANSYVSVQQQQFDIGANESTLERGSPMNISGLSPMRDSILERTEKKPRPMTSISNKSQPKKGARKLVFVNRKNSKQIQLLSQGTQNLLLATANNKKYYEMTTTARIADDNDYEMDQGKDYLKP